MERVMAVYLLWKAEQICYPPWIQQIPGVREPGLDDNFPPCQVRREGLVEFRLQQQGNQSKNRSRESARTGTRLMTMPASVTKEPHREIGGGKQYIVEAWWAHKAPKWGRAGSWPE